MATYWTLEAAGHEKSFRDWGLSLADFQVERMNKAKATATLRTTEAFDAGAAQWSYFAHAIIRRDRASSDGSADSFSSGSIYFQGYFDDPERGMSRGRENIYYKLHNVQWLLERNHFKQSRHQFTGWDGSHQRVVVVSVYAGGTGYIVGDVLSVAGGTGTAAQITVAAVGGSGAVTVVFVSNGGGLYTAAPATPNTPTGGSGTGAQFSLQIGQVPLLTAVVMSEVFLGEQLNATYTSHWSNGAQISEVLDWVNECYNPTKRGATSGRDNTQDVLIKGTIDPHTYAPIIRVNSLFCNEAIANCLRWDPDAVLVEDPTTTPPTLSIRKLGKWNYSTVPPTFIDYTNLTEVTITISADQENEMRLQSQLARNLPGVIIYYKSVNIIDAVATPTLLVDKYPSGITDWTPEVSSHTIELLGAKLSHVQATVKGTAIAPVNSGTLATRVAWWLARDRSLQDPNIDASSIVVGSPTIVDSSGSAIDISTYLYELQSGLPSWVGGSVVKAHISAMVQFNRFADSAHHIPDTKKNDRQHTHTVQLTNIPPGNYSAIAHFESAEIMPIGVSESVYRCAAATQYAGSLTFVASQLRSDISMGVRLKLIGPTTTFTNLLVQSIDTRPGMGETTVKFGPYPIVDVDAWIELARASRTRITYDMPSGRGDGGGIGAGGIDNGADVPVDNTSHGVGGAKLQGTAFIQVA